VFRVPTTRTGTCSRLVRIDHLINSLDPLDREVVVLRHFEQLSRAETAQVLGMIEGSGAKRCIRALKKLKTILAATPGGLEGL
jgi:RNA polymerase sigma-70 factor (ECF subfamily)